MSVEQYLNICEQLGQEPEEDKLPPDINTLSLEVQQALLMLRVLPDSWEGMSGVWLGKNYSALDTIMNIYDIDNKREVFELIRVGEDELHKYYKQQQKSKAK